MDVCHQGLSFTVLSARGNNDMQMELSLSSLDRLMQLVVAVEALADDVEPFDAALADDGVVETGSQGAFGPVSSIPDQCGEADAFTPSGESAVLVTPRKVRGEPRILVTPCKHRSGSGLAPCALRGMTWLPSQRRWIVRYYTAEGHRQKSFTAPWNKEHEAAQQFAEERARLWIELHLGATAS